MRLYRTLLAAVLAAGLCIGTVSAKSISYTPYQGYEYNSYEESVAAPVGYVPAGTITSADMGLEVPLNSPSDMVLRDNGDLYILDSGNGRILRLDSQWKVQEIWDAFTDADGSRVDFTGAQGLTVHDDGTLYVADTENGRILVLDPVEKKVLQTIGRPDHALQGTDTPFRVTKVLLDRQDLLYALVESVNSGALVFNRDGEFLRFFGSNPITATAQVLFDYIRKRFMTSEQRERMLQHTPTTFSNFDVDADGFIFTVTPNTESVPGEGLVRKLNYSGDNVLSVDGDPLVFGDLEWDRVQFDGDTTSFVDIDVDELGYMNLLDGGRNKIFQYNQTGELVAVFGGSGNQSGMFTSPVALESAGDRVLVLDSRENCLYTFLPSEYGSLLRSTFLKLDDSDTQGALELWTQAMKANTNSLYPYYGMGISYDAAGDYQQAMAYFKLAGAQDEYSKSFREYRDEFVSANILWILPCVIVVIVALVLALRAVKHKVAADTGTAFSFLETRALFPLYTTVHPVDGFSQFKTRHMQSYGLSALIVVLLFVVSTLNFFGTGFIFRTTRPEDYNLPATLIATIGLFILFVASNWSICTLMDGKGSLKEIVAVTAYSLVPFLVGQLLTCILSNILTAEEAAFLTILQVIAIGWSVLLLIGGMYSIHQYSFMQTIGSLLLTVVGVAVISVLLILLFTLMQQVISFGQSLVEELALRR